MNRCLLLPVVLAVTSSALCALGQPSPVQQASLAGASQVALSEADADFLREMAQFSQGLLIASILAVLKSGDPRVRDFAGAVLGNQERMNIALSRVAGSRGIELGRHPSSRQLEQLDLLKLTTGVEFDRQFMQAFGVESQRWALRQINVQLVRSSDPEIIRFARELSPALEQSVSVGVALAASIGRELPGENRPAAPSAQAR